MRKTFMVFLATTFLAALGGCAGTKLHDIIFAYRNPNNWDDQYCQSS